MQRRFRRCQGSAVPASLYMSAFADWFIQLGESKGPEGETVSDGGTMKRLVMLALLVLVTIRFFGLSCASLGTDLGLYMTCDQPGAMGLVKALALAIAANQGTYKLTKRPKIRAIGKYHPELPF